MFELFAGVCVVLGNTAGFPKWLYHFTFPPAVYKSSNCSTSCQHLVSAVFHFSHSGECDISLWFYLHFCDDWWHWAFFHVFIGHFDNCPSLLSFYQFGYLFLIDLYVLFIYSGYESFVRYTYGKYLSSGAICPTPNILPRFWAGSDHKSK